MKYLLNIHTSTETAIVNICDERKVLTTLINTEQKQHAAFLHSAIRQILSDNNIKANELKAIGVTGGPGSYTGIRIGMATAKGLCYALKIPLLLFNTLEVMALSAIESIGDKKALYCPLIDARRQEVFTGVYNYELDEVSPPSSMILNENSFNILLQEFPVYFFGSGSEKFKLLAKNITETFFIDGPDITSQALFNFSLTKFQNSSFENPYQAQPLYIKNFYLAKN